MGWGCSPAAGQQCSDLLQPGHRIKSWLMTLVPFCYEAMQDKKGSAQLLSSLGHASIFCQKWVSSATSASVWYRIRGHEQMQHTPASSISGRSSTDFLGDWAAVMSCGMSATVMVLLFWSESEFCRSSGSSYAFPCTSAAPYGVGNSCSRAVPCAPVTIGHFLGSIPILSLKSGCRWPSTDAAYCTIQAFLLKQIEADPKPLENPSC